MTPASAFPVGASGGDHIVTIGAGTPAPALDASHLSAGGLTLARGGGSAVTLTEGDQYTKRSGSIIITLGERYLNTLPVGAYTLSARITGGLYDGYTVALPFTVTSAAPTAAQAPKTGDGAAPGLWLGLCGLALCGLAGYGLLALRRKKGRRR